MTDEKSDRAAPMIGQFSGPPTNAPRVALRRKDSEEEPETEASSSEEPGEEEVGFKPQTPEDVEKEFLEGLKEVGLDINKARAIMDEVLAHGHYTETRELRGKPIVIRSRNYRDTLRTQQYLEAENPTYATSMDEIVLRYNAAASLVQFGEHKFEHPEDRADAPREEIEEAFDKRLNFLQTLPSIMVGKLSTAVYNMDVKLQAVFAEGAPEDF